MSIVYKFMKSEERNKITKDAFSLNVWNDH